MEGAGGEGKERGKGGRDFIDTGTFWGGVTRASVLKSQMGEGGLITAGRG